MKGVPPHQNKVDERNTIYFVNRMRRQPFPCLGDGFENVHGKKLDGFENVHGKKLSSSSNVIVKNNLC